MYKVLFNSCHAPVEIEKWLNDELALGNKFIACNGDFYIFEAVEHRLHADGANVCHVVEHVFIDDTCAMCGFPKPRPAGKA